MIHASCIIRHQFRCAHDLRIIASVSIMKGVPRQQRMAAGGSARRVANSMAPPHLKEGEEEDLSLINHSFGDGPSVQCKSLHLYGLSLSFILKEGTGSRRGKQRNKRTHPPLPCLFFICAIARQSWVFGDFRPFGDYRPLPRLFAHNNGW